MAALFTPHRMLLETAFSEVKRVAEEQPYLFVGSPGSVGARVVRGRRFLYRQFYDAEGKKTAEYLGPEGDAAAHQRAGVCREQIARAGQLAKEVRLLAAQGYARADGRAAAVLAALANRGLFRAGAVLVGSHAYGALLNELGVRAAAYATEDVDIARGAPLDARELSAPFVFAEALEASTLPLVPVPGSRHAPATSYKAKGKNGVRVDLIVPSGGTEIGTKHVPELGAHATAIPHLRALLDDPIETVVLSRDVVVPVRVPRPERYVWHKIQLPVLRTNLDKKRKDATQAAVLFAALAESDPAALSSSYAALSPASRRRIAEGARQVSALLAGTPHRRAIELLEELRLT